MIPSTSHTGSLFRAMWTWAGCYLLEWLFSRYSTITVITQDSVRSPLWWLVKIKQNMRDLHSKAMATKRKTRESKEKVKLERESKNGQRNSNMVSGLLNVMTCWCGLQIVIDTPPWCGRLWETFVLSTQPCLPNLNLLRKNWCLLFKKAMR